MSERLEDEMLVISFTI